MSTKLQTSTKKAAIQRRKIDMFNGRLWRKPLTGCTDAMTFSGAPRSEQGFDSVYGWVQLLSPRISNGPI